MKTNPQFPKNIDANGYLEEENILYFIKSCYLSPGRDNHAST